MSDATGVKYPANLTTCLQELHLRDVRFDLAKEIMLSMPDLMNENASTLSVQACAIAAALAADAERLGWLTLLPKDHGIPAQVTEQIERAIGAQTHAHQIQQDIASHTINVVPRGFGSGH